MFVWHSHVGEKTTGNRNAMATGIHVLKFTYKKHIFSIFQQQNLCFYLREEYSSLYVGTLMGEIGIIKIYTKQNFLKMDFVLDILANIHL